MVKVLETLENGIAVFEISNEQIKVVTSNYGCTIMKIIVKDKDGKDTDVVLGHDTIQEYDTKRGEYIGAIVGRVANRIAKGNFVINGKEYQLTINNGPNTNHGGIDSFTYKTFDYEILDNGIRFHYLSPDGEENFPGNLSLYATYTIDQSALTLHYEATTDQDTLVGITNHSYFNLNGKPSNIDTHILQAKADYVGCVDGDGLFTGQMNKVDGTPFDFRTPTLIKDMIYQDNEQLKIGKGYDHSFLFNTDKDQVVLYSEQTGIEMTMSTTLPQAQLYSANYLCGKIGKNGLPLNERDAMCVETQYMPDSIHQEENPSVLLKKGEKYDEQTTFRFGVRK